MKFHTPAGVLALVLASLGTASEAYTLQQAAQPAETLALAQVVQSVLLWSDTAFRQMSPLAVLPGGGPTILRPEIGNLIRAAYDPVLPPVARDPSHALRLFARMRAAE